MYYSFLYLANLLNIRSLGFYPALRWPITATAKTKRNTVNKEIFINKKKVLFTYKKGLLSNKKDLLTKKKDLLTQKKGLLAYT